LDINSNDHIYQAAPPYRNNRDLPILARLGLIDQVKADNEGLSDGEVWEKVKALAGDGGMVWFGVQAVSMPESDDLDRKIAQVYHDYARDKAAELEQGKRMELLRSKLKSINNLVLSGVKITDFDTFYRLAPREMVHWLLAAVNSTITLSEAEIKNFMPE
jgi:hypothetical protein